MILITTTRRPSRRTRSFVRDLYHVIPGAIRRNRGKMSLEDLNELALQLGAGRVLVVGTSKGNPSSLTFYEPSLPVIRPLSIIYLKGVSLRREITDRRAPSFREMCVTYSSPDLTHLAQVLSLSLQSGGPVLSSLDQLHLIRECDLVLHLTTESGILASASFYTTGKTVEIGPRMRIGRFRELEGEGEPEA